MGIPVCSHSVLLISKLVLPVHCMRNAAAVARQSKLTQDGPSAAEARRLRMSGRGGRPACRMVDAGEVYAQIDEAASTVRFLQDPGRYDSASVVQRLDSQMKRAMALGERIRVINNKVNPAL